MTLKLYSHPLASFCHKVLIAFYEAETPFEPLMVDLGDPGDHARFLDLWPVGKMPVLRDEGRNETIPEASIIIEYLDQNYPGVQTMLPADPATCLRARLWDRFFDLYVQEPMQKIVFDSFRPEDRKDKTGVEAAEQRLMQAYEMVENHMKDRTWAAGDDFSIAECSAAPALFFAGIIVPFKSDQSALRGYFERLVDRPSFRRVLVEARPYFDNFPFRDRIPQQFLTVKDA
ncbi:glutathione S-transferase family protein [Roseovarius atlanticus]|uniref:glutathione S-transferase family protein n=1 Tax=Roseovarius atlanticus TaxID=1641875 RepID=UPI0028F74591|nr:glutathione S-transferase family protein [Roseovarius atlanticus]